MQFKDIFSKGFYNITVKGFERGVKLLLTEGAIFTIIVLFIFIFIHIYAMKKDEKASKSYIVGIAFGFLLFLAPMTPFFIIKDSYIPIRNVVPSFLGMAIMGDIIINLIFRNYKINRIIAGTLLVIFSICGFSELESYKITSEQDKAVALALEGVEIKEKSAIIGLEEVWDKEQNFVYKEHIMSACSSDWAFTGMLRCRLENQKIPIVTPISKEVPYMSWSKNIKSLDNFENIYFYDNGEIIELQKKKLAEDYFELYSENELFAIMEDKEGQGVFTVYDK